MRITYTEHAEARMDFRKISKTEIEEAISQPYFTALSRWVEQSQSRRKKTSI